jgi:hypothetical protein
MSPSGEVRVLVLMAEIVNKKSIKKWCQGHEKQFQLSTTGKRRFSMQRKYASYTFPLKICRVLFLSLFLKSHQLFNRPPSFLFTTSKTGLMTFRVVGKVRFLYPFLGANCSYIFLFPPLQDHMPWSSVILFTVYFLRNVFNYYFDY